MFLRCRSCPAARAEEDVCPDPEEVAAIHSPATTTPPNAFTPSSRMSLSHRENVRIPVRYPISPVMHAKRIRHVLFVCRLNRSRSATAERVFCKRADLEVRSAGTSDDALV